MVKAIYVARCARGAKWDLFNLVHKLIYFFPFFLGSAVAWWTWSWKCRPTGGVSSCRHFWTSSHFLSSIFPIIKEDRVEEGARRPPYPYAEETLVVSLIFEYEVWVWSSSCSNFDLSNTNINSLILWIWDWGEERKFKIALIPAQLKSWPFVDSILTRLKVDKIELWVMRWRCITLFGFSEKIWFIVVPHSEEALTRGFGIPNNEKVGIFLKAGPNQIS